MRLLVVCGAGYISGLERVTLDLLREIRGRHEVRCATSTWGDGEFFRRVGALGLPCTRLPMGFISKTLRWEAVLMTLDQGVRLPELLMGWRRLAREFRPEAVLMTNYHHAILLGAFLPESRCWLHVHNAWAETPFHRRVAGWLSRRYRGFVAISDFVRDRLLRLGVAPDKIVRVHNGVDFPGALPERPPREEGAPFVVGIVGQVGAWKGHEDLLRAVAIARAERPELDLRVRVFGADRDAYAGSLRQQSAGLGLASVVEWMGFQDSAADIYSRMDVCVVPSRFEEPFGLVAAEAGAWGLPVIATRRGGLPEIVEDGVTGLLVDAQAPEQIAKALVRLAIEPGFRESLGNAARRRVRECFGAKRMAAEIERLLEG